MDKQPVIIINGISKSYSNGTTVLNDIQLGVYRGEAVGIVGKNGAGKSTLLKILSGVTKPTSGTATIIGQVSSMLSVGAGLHPDLTGIENLNVMATLANIKGQKLKDAIEQITAFSELGDHINAAVKTYSDGMYVRLMLSSFFFFPCDILLIDEVIAAGDAGFRAKCYRQFELMLAQGKTIVFATHNMQDVLTLCTKAIYLDKEIKFASTDPSEVVNKYLKDVTSGMKTFDPTWIQHADTATNTHIDLYTSALTEKVSNSDFRLISASVYALGKELNESITIDDQVTFELVYEKLHSEGAVELGIKVFSLQDTMLLADSNTYRKDYTIADEEKGKYTLIGSLPSGFLNHGTYYIGLVVSLNKVHKGTWQNVLRFDVLQSEWRKKEPWSTLPVQVLPRLQWTVKKG